MVKTIKSMGTTIGFLIIKARKNVDWIYFVNDLPYFYRIKSKKMMKTGDYVLLCSSESFLKNYLNNRGFTFMSQSYQIQLFATVNE